MITPVAKLLRRERHGATIRSLTTAAHSLRRRRRNWVSAVNERASPPHHARRRRRLPPPPRDRPFSARLVLRLLPAARQTPPRPVPTFKLVKCSLLARASLSLSLSDYALRINAFRGIFVAANLKVSFTVCDCVIPARSSSRVLATIRDMR